MKPVCLVIGAGAGIGGTVGKRFAREGYHAVLCRRSDDTGLRKMVESIEGEGGSASGFLLNATDADTLEERVAAVEASTGPIEVVIFNLGAQIGDRALADTSYKAFELGWRLATFALFRVASAVCPLMEERGKGTILVTSATAAMRGKRWAALPRGSHGRATHALPDSQRGVRTQGHPCRSHPHRWGGRRPRHARENAGPRAIPAAPRVTRHGARRTAPACRDRRYLLPSVATAPLRLDPRDRSAVVLGPPVVEPLTPPKLERAHFDRLRFVYATEGLEMGL